MHRDGRKAAAVMKERGEGWLRVEVTRAIGIAQIEGGKFARARLERREEGGGRDEFAAIRENRKFNLRVPPLDKNSLAPLDTLPSTSIELKSECRRLVGAYL